MDWVSDPTLTPPFQALPGASFIVNGAPPAKDFALASAGAEIRFANGITLLAQFDGEFASKSQTYGPSHHFAAKRNFNRYWCIADSGKPPAEHSRLLDHAALALFGHGRHRPATFPRFAFNCCLAT
jgi:hypothetical protein